MNLEKTIHSWFIFLLVSIIILAIWNVLNFFIFQWFGFRYYSFTLSAIIMVFPVICLVGLPFAWCAGAGAPALGIALSGPLLLIALGVMRWEAGIYRENN